MPVSEHQQTIVDFVARDDSKAEWTLVLVEEGPWTGAITENLRRVQERLYRTLDAALSGQVAEKYPESQGRQVVIRVDGYNLPTTEVNEFFERFSKGVLLTAAYKRSLQGNTFVKGISFELNLDAIH